MAPSIEENHLAMLKKGIDSSNGLSSIETTAVVMSVLTSFAAIASLLVIVFVCGCCGGGDEPKVEEHQRKASQKEPEPPKKAVTGTKVVILKPEMSDKGDVQMIPHENRQMPAPKHKVPLAPPGFTVPPVYMPDDDDKTVQNPMKQSSQVTGSKKG